MSPQKHAIDPGILAHYQAIEEATRLERSDSRLELVRSQQIIGHHLPAPPRTVLDVGGAAGVYSFWLAEQGYRVHLVDLMAKHVEQARQRTQAGSIKLESISTGDARSLEFADASMDAVLLMGPMYHLQERSDRIAALRESQRVLRPGGLVFVAAISRFTSLLDGILSNYMDDPAFRKIVEGDLADGRHINEANHPAYFTTAYFHHPDELPVELSEAGLAVVDMQGVEGPFWMLRNFDEHWSDPERRDRLIAAAERLGKEPALLGASAHLMAVGRKK